MYFRLLKYVHFVVCNMRHVRVSRCYGRRFWIVRADYDAHPSLIGQALLHLDSLPVHLILPLQISLALSLHCLCLLLRIHRPPWHHLHLQAATDTSASLELWRLALCIGSMDKRTFFSFRAVSYVLTSKAKLLSK
ncbi:hypothetical protein BT93_C0798 [Corymbia citriodora subsp. variegata]|nr:hypothetical protein BT93_C0798 [Corymbia citriodora subsp. variegata]